MSKDPKKPDILMGFLIAAMIVIGIFEIFALSYIGWEMVPFLLNGGISAVQASAQPTATQPAPQPPAEVSQSVPESEPPSPSLSFELVAGEAGDYGKQVTFNEGTEFEETFYAYYVPAGQYTVTNTGEYTSQINVYSDERTVTDAGWEEPAESIAVKLLDVGQSADIEIGNNQYIEIAEPSTFKMEANNLASGSGGGYEPPTETPAATDPPAAQTTAPEPTTAPVTETKVPEPTKTPTPTKTPAAQTNTTGGAYVGSSEKTVYHKPTCSSVDQILPEHMVWFDTVDEAKADGRRACKRCNPG